MTNYCPKCSYKLVIVGIVPIILFAIISGCTGSDNDSKNTPSSTSTYTSKLVYVHSDSQAKITEACIEVQNTGDDGAWFVVDFEFIVYDEEKLGQGVDMGGSTTNGIPIGETYHIEKQVYVAAHKTDRVYCQPWSWKPAISLKDYDIYLD